MKIQSFLRRCFLGSVGFAVSQAQFSEALKVSLSVAFGMAIGSGSLMVTSLAAGPTHQQLRQQYNELISRGSLVAEKEFLSVNESRSLFTKVQRHPVAALSNENVKKYDPQGVIGFCFGRAMTVHILAREMGLKDSSIKKMFIVGDLTQTPPKPEWRFHVATMIRVKMKGTSTPDPVKWVAIDPIMGGPMLAEEWITYVRKTWDYTKKSKLYVVKPDVVIPDLSNVPDIAKETGAHLIELKFSPEGKPGFFAESMGQEPVYRTDTPADDQYFSNVNEKQQPFHFLDITINGMKITYSNYFSDLIQMEYSKLHRRGNENIRLSGKLNSEILSLPSPQEHVGLGSFKLNELLHGGRE